MRPDDLGTETPFQPLQSNAVVGHADDVFSVRLGDSSASLMAVPGGELDGLFLLQGPVTAVTQVSSELGLVDLTPLAAINSVIGAAIKAQQSARLVRLHPDAVRQLRNGARLIRTADGYNHGVLVAADGKFLSSVKWRPVGKAAASAAGLAQLASGAVMQYQMQQLQNGINDIKAAVSRLEAAQRIRDSSHFEALMFELNGQLRKALAANDVPPVMLQQVQCLGREADVHVRRLTKELQDHLITLGRVNGQKQRLKWLEEHGYDAAHALVELRLACRGWLLSQMLEHAGYASPAGSATDGASALASEHRAIMQERSEQVASMCDDFAFELMRGLEVALAVTGRVRVTEKLSSRGRVAAKEHEHIRDTAMGLRTYLESQGVLLYPAPDLPEVPEIGTLTGKYDSDWRQVLPTRLHRGENVYAIIHGKGLGLHPAANKDDAAFVITDSRLLAFRKQALAEVGGIYRDIPLARIGQLRLDSSLKFPQLRLCTVPGSGPVIADFELGMPTEEVEQAIALIEHLQQHAGRPPLPVEQ